MKVPHRWLVLALATAAFGAWAGSAVASCNPGRSNTSGNWHAGWYKDPPSGLCYTGNVANILVYSPYVFANDVTAWVMLENAGTGSYGQVGWLQQAGGTRYNFTESSTQSGGFQQRMLSPSSLGSSPAYKITYSASTFYYFVDGTSVDTDSVPGWGGCEGQTFGEVTSLANQMPGGYNSHEPITSDQVRRNDTNTWYYMDGNTSTERSDLFGTAKVSSTRVEIWDKACAS
jgi:hypothetical protein